jgi:hypothetical protein
MVSDDLTAFAAISMGALASAAVTLALAGAVPDLRDDIDEQRSVTVVAPDETARCASPGPTIDFAIIRSGGDGPETHLMVGPEGLHSGREPEASLQLRLLRGR